MESEKIVVFLMLIVILLSVGAIVIVSKINSDSVSKFESNDNFDSTNYANVGFEIISTSKNTRGVE